MLRTKWKGLKDGYTKYKKQVKGSTGSAKTYTNWCWGPHLLFLDNFIKQRESTSNISTASQETSASSILSPSQPIPTMPLLQLQQDNETSQDNNNILEEISPTPATPTPLPSTSMSTSRTSHRTSEPSRSRAVATKPDEDVEKILNFMRSKRIKQSDAIDDLFMSYAKTFKTFSIQTQTMLKVEMAKLFADAELREHMNQNQSPVYSLINIDSNLTTEDSFDQQAQQSPTITTFEVRAPSISPMNLTVPQQANSTTQILNYEELVNNLDTNDN